MPDTETKWTPGPWYATTRKGSWDWLVAKSDRHEICQMFHDGTEENELGEANARLVAAAPELAEAAMLQEAADLAHANCDECDGDGVPECCEKCFPLFDEARLKRRAAIAKATNR